MQSSTGQRALVFFDLETTGLDVSVCDIVQLSAICGETFFNKYTVPRCSMTEGASKVTGFTMSEGTLLLHGRTVDTVLLREALVSFITFLRTFNKPLLVAHNAARFDAPVLVRALKEFSLLDTFEKTFSGFLDTLLLSKDLLADTAVRKYSQPYLYSFFLKKSYDAHNALEDVRALQEMYNIWRPDRRLVSKHVSTLKQLHYPPL